MTRQATGISLLWLAAVCLCAALALRAHYSADLSAFLPRAPSHSQRLLVQQLRDGPTARLIMASISGGSPDTRAQLSRQLAAQLARDPAFASISNGDSALEAADRAFLFRHRYQLSPQMLPQHFSAAGLRAALQGALQDLAGPAGVLMKPLFEQDPTGELLAILSEFGSQPETARQQGVWASADGTRALLAIQTRASGSDTDAQEAAGRTIRGTFDRLAASLAPGPHARPVLQLGGAPVFAVRSRALVKEQVLRLSMISSLLIAGLLLIAYRSFTALLLGLLPVACGALAGVAAVACGFGVVHGVTLGFGVTLIGEAVDYSIYLFLQKPAAFRTRVWPTIRLGVLTSLCGFAALLPSAFPGLAQLGLYSVAGLTAAALVTRYVLPLWLPQRLRLRDLTGLGERLARIIAALRPARLALLPLAVAAAAVLWAHRGTLWSRDLASLSPVPAAAQALDARTQADLGIPDVRYIIVITAPGQQQALALAQTLSSGLQGLVDAGALRGFQTPSRLLPDANTQRARQAGIPPPPLLRQQLDEALAGLPIRRGVLQPFLSDAEQSRALLPLRRTDLEGTSFAAAVDALLFESGGAWTALLPLSDSVAAGQDRGTLAAVHALIAARLAATRGAAAGGDVATARGAADIALLDFKGESDRMYAGYLGEAEKLALAGFAAIVLLLVLTLRSARRVFATVAPLALSVLVVAALLVTCGRQLGILHIVGMLLIVAVGSNYALFFDRGATSGDGHAPLTLASLAVANLATVTAFAVLACSRVSVLSDLGMTVAPGALLALWFCALLAPVKPDDG
ncbi:MAG: MMPL family transporter [Proteobacteria bacterium]|nr:MMPL family transporter [Pseudomonadota bacterium]